MLSKNSIRIAGTIVASLESVAVMPLEGTVVGQLTDETISGATGLPGETVDQNLHEGSMLQNAAGVHRHDAMSEDAVAIYAGALAEHFRFARHVVNPAITTVATAVIDKVGARAPLHNLSQFSLARVHTSPTTAELIANHNGIESFDTQLFANFPERDEADLVSALQTGSAEFDGDVQDMLANRPTGWINDVHYRYFGQGNMLSPTRDLHLADELLVVNLLSRSYYDAPPAGVPMSLAEFNSRMTAITAQTAASLNEIYRRYDRLVLNGALVWKFPPTKDVLESDKDGAIIVLGPVYQAFVADGGTPEVIFGAAISDRASSRDDLLAKRDDYLVAYTRFCERQTRMRNSRIAEIAKVELGAAASKMVTQLESQLPQGTDIAAVQQLLAQQVDLVDQTELLEDTRRAVRRALCNSVFVHTDALKILERIDTYVERNPELSPGKAATLAAISILVEHQLSQVAVARGA